MLTKVATPMLLAALGFALAVAPLLTLLATSLLLPGLIAWMHDPAPGRPVGRTMLGFGAAAAYGPVAAMVRQGTSAPLSASLLPAAEALGLAWGAAGMGWILCQAFGLAFAAYAQRQASAEVKRLLRARRELEIEWDIAPKAAGPRGGVAGAAAASGGAGEALRLPVPPRAAAP